jgi:hypothetical protein
MNVRDKFEIMRRIEEAQQRQVRAFYDVLFFDFYLQYVRDSADAGDCDG